MKNKKTQKIIIVAVVAILILAAIIFGVRALMQGNKDKGEIVYSTTAAKKGTIEVAVETKGQLQASWGGGLEIPGGYSSDGVSVSYVIEQIFVEEGSEVTEGQVVARLGSSGLKNQLESKEKELKSLLQELADMTGLPVSQVEGINPAKGLILRAPIDGRVTELAATEGTELESGKLVANIVDDDKFIIKATVLPAELPRFTVGGPVILKFPYFEGTTEATVTSINPNSIPIEVKTGDKLTTVVSGHVMMVTGRNPGLVQKGMEVGIGVKAADGINVQMCYYPAKIERFTSEEKLFNRATAIVSEVYAYNYQLVKAGDPILSLSGEKMQQAMSSKQEQVRKLRLELADLQSQTSNMDVKSPITGVVSSINAKVGDTVQRGQWIGDTYNTKDMMLMAMVDDIDVINVAIDAPVKVTVDAIPGQTFDGVVTNISTRGENGNTGGSSVTKYSVDIKMQGGPGLRPGMQAKVKIDSGRAENVLLIPVEALFEENGQQMVEVLKNGKPKIVKVKVGLMNSRMAQIEEGLKRGDLVITGSSEDVLPTESIKTDQNFIPSTGGDKDKKDDKKDSGAKDNGAAEQ